MATLDVAPATGVESSMKSRKDRKQAPFDNLPDEIITQILQLSDPNSFASLIVLTRKWRRTSQQAHLYALQLSRCPSYLVSHREVPLNPSESELPDLRRRFAVEVKRNLFDAYMRPQVTTIKLVSTNISSSAAFPGGEAFHFSFSPLGRFLLAYSSSRLHIIDVSGPEIQVKRRLKVHRRPVSTAILDDGSLLAVLNTSHRIDLYCLRQPRVRHFKVVEFDNPVRTIALSPVGSVLAAAYDGGIEVCSFSADFLADRRSVKCDPVDRLSFSPDGTQLLGTTQHLSNSSTVILTAPYYDPGALTADDSISQLWTTSILFPNSTRDCSHASLLDSPESSLEASWIFAYDRSFETFRAVRTDDLRNGTTYFTGPLAGSASSKLLPSTLAAPSRHGELVAAGFEGKDIWLYGIPEDLDALPDGQSQQGSDESGIVTPRNLGTRNSQSTLSPGLSFRDGVSRIPQWQLLCDKFRNTFIQGRNVAQLEGISSLKWVSGRKGIYERLVGVAPGMGDQFATFDEEPIDPIDGGRISFFDFSYSLNNGSEHSVTLEVGEEDEVEELVEKRRDMAAEVALVRKRTVAQQRRNNPRSTQPDMLPKKGAPSKAEDKMPFIPPDTKVPLPPISPTEQSDTTSLDDGEGFDDPYSQAAPRSVVTLRRAATAAAMSRRIHNPPTSEGQPRLRPADGRGEVPHESDADNWVPPPPPYSKEPTDTLPFFLRSTFAGSVPPNAGTVSRTSSQRSWGRDESASSGLRRSHTIASSSSSERMYGRVRFPRRRDSDMTLLTNNSEDIRSPLSPGLPSHAESQESPKISPEVSPEISPVPDAQAPSGDPQRFSIDDIYDVSPPDSPIHRPAQPATVVSSESSEPLSPTSHASSSSVPVMESSLRQPAPPMPEAMARYMYKKNLENPPNETVSSTNTRAGPGPRTADQQAPPRSQAGYFDQIPRGQPSTPPRRANQRPVTTMSPPRGTPQRRPASASFPSPIVSPHSGSGSPGSYVVSPISRGSPQSSIATRHSQRSGSLPQVLTQRASDDSNIPRQQTQSPQVVLPPAAGTWPISSHQVSQPVGAPSSEQLARLNRRSSRPNQFNPAKAGVPPRVPVGSRSSMPPPPRPNMYTPQSNNRRMEQSAVPPGAVGAVGSYSSTVAPSKGHNGPVPTPRGTSMGNGRYASSTPNLRPPMTRLETIHSHSSIGDGAPISMIKEIKADQPLPAPFSAVKPSKSTSRRRGWSGTVRRKKGDGSVISAISGRTGKTSKTEPWTRVEHPSAPRGGDTKQAELDAQRRQPSRQSQREKKGGKCVVM